MTPRPFAKVASTPVLLGRGVTRRCGWCGDRKAYFLGWFKRQDRCRACHRQYRRGDEAFELGAVTANIILTFLGVLGATLISILVTLPEPDLVWVVGTSATIALVGPALFYPISFTLWQAVDLTMRRPTPAELAGADGRL